MALPPLSLSLSLFLCLSFCQTPKSLIKKVRRGRAKRSIFSRSFQPPPYFPLFFCAARRSLCGKRPSSVFSFLFVLVFVLDDGWLAGAFFLGEPIGGWSIPFSLSLRVVFVLEAAQDNTKKPPFGICCGDTWCSPYDATTSLWPLCKRPALFLR